MGGEGNSLPNRLNRNEPPSDAGTAERGSGKRGYDSDAFFEKTCGLERM